MRKRKKMNKIEDIAIQSPVAKFAHQFNKAQVFADKREYRRKQKHVKQDASPVILPE